MRPLPSVAAALRNRSRSIEVMLTILLARRVSAVGPLAPAARCASSPRQLLEARWSSGGHRPDPAGHAGFDAPADAGVSPVAAFVVCFLIAFIGSSLMNMPEADDDALAGMSAPPKKKKKKERASPTKIGWLTTDMRVPLPTLEELENGCHLLNTLDGERFYLCTATSKLSESNCELSDDFSAYYNAPVYTCIA